MSKRQQLDNLPEGKMSESDTVFIVFYTCRKHSLCASIMKGHASYDSYM